MFGINVEPGKSKPLPGPTPDHTLASKKPPMKGMLINVLKRRLIIAGLFMFTTTLTWRIAVVQRRINAYRDFYSTYDPMADFERMKKVGVFQSVKPDGSVGEL